MCYKIKLMYVLLGASELYASAHQLGAPVQPV